MSDVKIVKRRGIPYPPPEIQGVLINHYLNEKAICKKILQLECNDPARQVLLSEVYQIAHDAMDDYVKFGFMSYTLSTSSRFCESVDRLFSKKGIMLELGCGRGYSLLAMKRLGWKCRGVEIDTKKVIDSVKNDVIEADILFFEDNQQYDLIVIDQVLEHIPKKDCLFFLKKIHKMLNKRGILVSRSPNPLNGPHDVSRWFVPLSMKAQGTHFNEMTLEETLFLMRKAGFKNFRTPISPFLFESISSKFPVYWTKNRIPSALHFEKIYPHLPSKIKPTSTFSIFVPDTVAAEK